MKTKTLKQTITFDCKPKEVYNLLMNPQKHSLLSGGKVKMQNKVNGKFEVFDGYCTGYNIALSEGKKIEQAWNFKEDGWPADHYSVCVFVFDSVNGKTKMRFVQSDIPAHKYEALKAGWKEYYWEPMKQLIRSWNS